MGDSVASGQVLASLDRALTERNLAIAEAALGAARAEEMKAAIELTQARRIFERRNQVAWALSKEELQGLGARESLALATLQVAQSRTAEQAAAVQQSRDDLMKCDVRAPFGGRIGRLYQSEGTLIPAGAPVARLVASTDLWVRFAVPPEAADSLQRGVQVQVVPEGGVLALRASVEHVAPEVDAAAGMVFIEARLRTTVSDGVVVRPGTVVRVKPVASPQ